LLYCAGVGEQPRNTTVAAGAVPQLVRLLTALPETGVLFVCLFY
jgi:hypothetical protein